MRKLTVVILVVSMIVSGCKAERIVSVVTEGKIKVDGRQDDWAPEALHIFQDQKLLIGIQNDRDYLYLFVRNWNSLTSRAGIMVWIYPNKKKKKEFGVRIPGMIPADGAPGWNNGISARPDSLPFIAILITPELQKAGQKVPLWEVPEIQVRKIRAQDGSVNLELRFPLRSENSLLWPVELIPGRSVMFGIEAVRGRPGNIKPKDASGFSGRPGGMKGGGGGRGMGGGKGRGGGGASGIRQASAPTYWFEIQLPSAQ